MIHTTLGLYHFEESEGEGITGKINNNIYKIGSNKFVCNDSSFTKNETSSFISIDNKYIGKFIFESEFRPGIHSALSELSHKYIIHILSGDKDKDKKTIELSAPEITHLHFNQSPQDKLKYIRQLEENGRKCIMIGDGLNDAGALEKANCGVAISEDASRFTPSSDAILDAKELVNLPAILKISNYASTILIVCYLFSLVYNIIGLSFALSGFLTPLIAAILMPISSISIVLISTIMARSKS